MKIQEEQFLNIKKNVKNTIKKENSDHEEYNFKKYNEFKVDNDRYKKIFISHRSTFGREKIK